MKEVIFTSDRPPNSEELRSILFADETDPRSTAYVRSLKRPDISWWNILLCVVGTGIFLMGTIWGLLSLRFPPWAQWVSIAGVILLYLLIHLKRIAVCCVRIYQRYAPDRIRNKCRFEPSCSEYMILAMQKYGPFRGIRKGIDRLKRCNVNNGGYDEP